MCFFFFKQKTAYEMRISDWSSDVCSSDLRQGDAAYKDWSAWMDKYNPEGDKKSTFTVYGYSVAQTLVQALEQCGDDLTRANVMKQELGRASCRARVCQYV